MTDAESVLSGYFLCEWIEGWDKPAADLEAQRSLRLLRSLPVEQRMEAMGMDPVETQWVYVDGGGPFAVVEYDVDGYESGPTFWIEADAPQIEAD